MNVLQVVLGGLGTLVSIGVGIGTLYQLFIRPVLRKQQQEMKRQLEDTGATSAWRTKTEGRLSALEQSDSRIYDGVENVRLGLEQLRQEISDAHTKANDHVHDEVRRLEEKMSVGSDALLQRIDKMRDEILRMMEK